MTQTLDSHPPAENSKDKWMKQIEQIYIKKVVYVSTWGRRRRLFLLFAFSLANNSPLCYDHQWKRQNLLITLFFQTRKIFEI